ncbi:MAG: ribosome maturation factor RimM [Chloroflexota bacterium]|nr:MAG: ribosome maturation factor RimM [Chloroflexota bacterium]
MRQPELRYLAIGRIIRAHGLRGEVSAAVLTDFPERFETTEWVYLGNEFEATSYRLQSFRWHKQNVLLTLEGVTNRTQAELLRGQLVQVPLEEAVRLPDGSYYLYQLIGLKVEDTSGKFLGTIKDVLETGANDVYVVEHESQELLLPAIPDVVKNVDIAAGIMVVHLMDGLI